MKDIAANSKEEILKNLHTLCSSPLQTLVGQISMGFALYNSISRLPAEICRGLFAACRHFCLSSFCQYLENSGKPNNKKTRDTMAILLRIQHAQFEKTFTVSD